LESGSWKLEVGDWLVRAIRVKVDIVARDPFEQSERAKLNLGHTFGHTLEKLSAYSMRHGDTVAIGLVCATHLAARLKLCDVSLVTRVSGLLRALELPTRVPIEMSADAILDAMSTDKKRVNGRLRFVLPRAPGEVVMVDDVTREDVLAAIDESR
ncbi:MAG: 3-dehydroquinate synthase, partial [Chloroflexota bacterium]